MKTYGVAEIFYSVQGEGSRAGTANVFIRLSGCNLACGYCDTDFETETRMTARAIAAEAARLMPAPRAVIVTGGEPLLQYDQQLHDALRAAGVCLIAIETNGSVKANAPVDFVACSPKCAEHVVKRNWPNGVDELRYVRAESQGLPKPAVKARHYFLSPEFAGHVLRSSNLNWCLKLVRENPTWALSVQMHKFLKVR